MSNWRKGIRLRLSPARKMMLEYLHHARQVPSLPLARTCNVRALAELRHESFAPSWIAIFLRAYGLVCQRHPELRRALIPWPYRHFYEHPHSEGALLLERRWQGEAVVFGAKIRMPEKQSLQAIDARLHYFRESPVEKVSYFRQILRGGRLPGFLRRMVFWQTLYLSGFTRAKRFGTFMISSLGNLGVEQLHPLTPLTTYFTFGPISPNGEVIAKIIYDHRVLDGRSVARALNELEEVLHTAILPELRWSALKKVG